MSIFAICHHQLVQPWSREKCLEKVWVMRSCGKRKMQNFTLGQRCSEDATDTRSLGVWCHCCHSRLAIYWIILQKRPFIHKLTAAFFLVRSIGSFTIFSSHLHIMLIWCEWNEKIDEEKIPVYCWIIDKDAIRRVSGLIRLRLGRLVRKHRVMKRSWAWQSWHIRVFAPAEKWRITLATRYATIIFSLHSTRWVRCAYT